MSVIVGMRTRSGPYVGPPTHRPHPGEPVTVPYVPVIDEPLGKIFRAMRAMLGAEISQAAQMLGTEPRVIIALEACDPSALPSGPEIRDIILRYGAMLSVDVQPALRRLQGLQAAPLATVPHRAPVADAAVPVMRPAMVAAVPQVAVPSQVRTFAQPPVSAIRGANQRSQNDAADDGDDRSVVQVWRARLKGLMPTIAVPRVSTWPSRRTALSIGLPIGFMLAALMAMATVPTALQASLSVLPDGISKSLKKRLERTPNRVETGPDGLKWIIVSDPRSRKADRLPGAAKP